MHAMLLFLLEVGAPLAGFVRAFRQENYPLPVASMFWMAALGTLYGGPFSALMVMSRLWYFDPVLHLGITLINLPIERWLALLGQPVITALLTIWLMNRFPPA
jgi:hypothetical protein